MEWFEFGVRAFQRARPGAPECYPCPLCLRGFRREHAATLLTGEHVPPKSVGGRRIVLTCRECNSTSGHRLDAQLRRRETLLDFARGTMTEPTSVVVDVCGTALRGALMATGENVEIRGHAQRNHPGVPSAVRAMCERIAADRSVNWSLGLRFEEGYRLRESLIGWLRAAYLVAFTALGYRYVLDQALDCVREQIRTPNVSIIKTFGVAMPTAPPRDRLLVFLQEPAEIRSVLVRMGAHVVFLPEPESREPGFYDRIQEGLARLGGRAQCKGLGVPWPTRPVFALDFLEGAESGAGTSEQRE